MANHRQERMQEYREYVKQTQRKRADAMIKTSASRYGDVDVGTNVRIPIESVDRGKIDPRNVIGVIMQNNNGYYKIGTEHGSNLKLLHSKIIKFQGNCSINLSEPHFQSPAQIISTYHKFPLPPLVYELPQNCPLNTVDKDSSIAHVNLDVEIDVAAEEKNYSATVNVMEVCHARTKIYKFEKLLLLKFAS